MLPPASPDGPGAHAGAAATQRRSLGLRGWLVVALACLSASASIVYPAVTQRDLWDPGLGGREGDAGCYVRIYRGEPLGQVYRPWRYRVLTPLLARAVPPLPGTLGRYFALSEDKRILFAFGMVNWAGLAAAGVLMVAWCMALGLGATDGVLAALLFYLTFPVTLFGGTPMVDAWAYALLLAGLLCAVKGSWPGVLIVTAVGMFQKETLLLLAPAIALLPEPPRRRALLLAALLPGVAAYAVFRWGLFPGGYGQPADPATAFAHLARNFARGPFWAWILFDGGLAFGAAWLLAAVGLARVRGPAAATLRRLAWLVPALLALPFLIDSNIGRVVVYAFPVVLPLAVAGLRAGLARGEAAESAA